MEILRFNTPVVQYGLRPYRIDETKTRFKKYRLLINFFKFGFVERFEMGYEWSEIFTIPVGEGLAPPVYDR